MRVIACMVVLLVAACGDDGASVDGGVDSGVARRDAGTDSGLGDAGPLPSSTLCDPSADPPGPYPAADAWPPNAGPGGPRASFDATELYTTCAFLDGGPMDVEDHHNLVVMIDGYLMMPWAPDYGVGGVTLWDVSDPCNPVLRGTGFSERMRETHAVGFSHLGGRWAVVDQLGSAFARGRVGIQFWDLSDTSRPRAVADAEFPETVFPDAYARVVLSAFWQVPYVYAGAADTGVFIVDATDPTDPRLVGHHPFEPVMRVGQVQAIGNLLIVTTAEGARTALLDISDPTEPQPIPGGDFHATDGTGEPREAYFTNSSGGFVYYARKEGGGGVFIWDVRDPTAPVFSGELRSDGNSGYVFVKEGLAFVGESRFAAIYDVRDHSSVTEVARLNLVGDLDTATPIGNVVVLSADEDAEPDRGSAVAPYATEPDSTPPAVTWTQPDDGATGLATTSRVGVTFSEMVDPGSAWAGSVRLYETGTDPDTTRVDGVVSAQEHIVNFHPRCELAPDTDYTVEITAGGVTDYNGNPIAETFTFTFRTNP